MPREKSGQKFETLEYIQSMLRQLRDMAETGRHEVLGYLIEMAYIEASDEIREIVPNVPKKETAV